MQNAGKPSTPSYESAIIGDRFGLGTPPTVLARTAAVVPIGFTRLKHDGASSVRAKDVPPERAFSVHVALRPTRAELWLDGRHLLKTRATAGDTFMFDLQRNPVSECHGPFDILRFYISQASLDELNRTEGLDGSMAFAQPPLGTPDRVMHGLASAMLGHLESHSERSTLFVDHIALAFHAHIIATYGTRIGRRARTRGALGAWQVRRAADFLSARLGDDPSVADVARECGLSAGYFIRAFRQATGVTPHQWLMRRRVECACSMLARGDLSLAEVAIACGFNDQSHFTRVFTHIAGQTPGAWRGDNRGTSRKYAF